jgi:hypothetical protein
MNAGHRLRKPLQVTTTAIVGAVLAAVLLAQFGAFAPIAQAVVGYDTPVETPTPTPTPETPKQTPAVPVKPVTPVEPADAVAPKGELPKRVAAPSGRTILRTGRIENTLTVSEPATVQQALYLDDGTAPKALAAKKAKRPTLLASGTATAKAAGKVKVKIKVNSKGRKVFKKAKVRVVLLTALVDKAGNRTALPAKRFSITR